jgi:hypothetical protein
MLMDVDLFFVGVVRAGVGLCYVEGMLKFNVEGLLAAVLVWE